MGTQASVRTTHAEALALISRNELPRKQGFVRLPVAFFVDRIDVKMDPVPGVDLFIEDPEKGGAIVQIRTSDQPYSPLALSVHEYLWIPESDFPKIRRHAENQILAKPQSQGTSASEAQASTPEKLQLLRATAMNVVDDLFQNPSPENIQRSVKVVSSFVYVIMRDPKAYLLLSKLSNHDPYTLQHSVGTAVNCIILAKKMGVAAEKDLQDVGLAGLLHDVGKVKVKKEIINKQGPLDELEWEEMRQHSLEGYEIIKGNPTLDERTKLAVLEHHEDKNGTGYPYGKRSTDLHLFSRIVCVCDIFNALTTDRSYSKARTPFDALTLIRDKMQHKVDEAIFREMVLVWGGKVEDPAPSTGIVP